MTGAPARTADRAEFTAGVVVTVLAHGALVALLAVSAGSQDQAAPSTDELPVIALELLQWGEAMPNPRALPEIANPEDAPQERDDTPPPVEPPPPQTALPQQEEVVLQPTPPQPERQPEENRAQPREQPRDAPARTDRGPTERRRPTNTSPIPGDPTGVRGGTSLSESALARQLATIVRQLNEQVRRPSTLTEDQWRALYALVHIRMNADGQITAFRFVDASGNRAFDSAVRSGFNRFQQGSLRLQVSTVTDQALRNILLNQGLNVYVAPR
jgi:outer membrane biosynthesis protein TonB